MATYLAHRQSAGGGAHPEMPVVSASGFEARIAFLRSSNTSTTTGTTRSLLQRATGGVTPTDRTEKANTRSPASDVDANTYGTAATLTGSPLLFFGAGERRLQRHVWHPPRTYAQPYLVDAELIGLDGAHGTSAAWEGGYGWTQDWNPGKDSRSEGRRARKSYYSYSRRNQGAEQPGTFPLGQQRMYNYVSPLRKPERRQPNTLTLLLAGGPGSFDLDANPGTYDITGAAAATVANRIIDANPGSYSLSGAVAALVRDISINAASGTYNVSGAVAGLIASHLINAAPGSYAVTGSQAALVRDIPLNAAPGSYNVSGSPAGVVANRVVDAAPGSYVITGSQAALVASRALNAVPGAYNLSGAPAGIVAVRVIVADPGSYGISGFDATLEYISGGPAHFDLAADPGSYALSGVDAGLVATYVMNAAPGSYALTGAQAATVADRVMNAAAGGYSVSGAVSGLIAVRSLNAAPGSYIVVGKPAELVVPGSGIVVVKATKWNISRPGFYG